MEYGTGAVMGVPRTTSATSSSRAQHGLPIRVVIQPEGETRDPDDDDRGLRPRGVMVNSGPFDGVPSPETIAQVTEWLEQQGKGRRARCPTGCGTG